VNEWNSQQDPEPEMPVEMKAPGSTAALMPRVYEELRRLARGHMAVEHGPQTLTATALVHEAWLQLGSDSIWANRRHFFGAAAEAMRRILIMRAREKNAAKRGSGALRVPLEGVEIIAEAPDEELLAVNDALDRFTEVDGLAAEIVRLRYFAGLTWPELAALLEMPERDLRRQWEFARAWLRNEISEARKP
jgi:RNA polymerase sigma factor (TIGR02999 family)